MIMGPRIAIQNHHLLDRPNAWFCHALKVNVYGNDLTSRMGVMIERIFSSQGPVSPPVPPVPTASGSDDRGPCFGRMHERCRQTNMQVVSSLVS